jgi:ribosome-binding protein aMBF1 (putative translation factor)
MTDLQNYIKNRKQTDDEFAENYDIGYESFKFGLIVKELRTKNGMTQEELAGKLHTTKTVISRMENHTSDIRLSMLAKIVGVFGKSLKIGIM